MSEYYIIANLTGDYLANATIENQDCTLFYDYDYHRDGILQKITPEGKITWLELRMRMIFLEPMSSLLDRGSQVFSELETRKNGRPRTGVLLSVSLLMNGIEALGSFLNSPGSTKRQNFISFMSKYMSDWNILVPSPRHNNQQTPLAQILWKDYRNGLAHSFAIGGAGIDVVQGSGKYIIDGGALQIDIYKFFGDFTLAVDKMFEEIRKDNNVKATFLSRFQDVYKC
jgi:hypothetical protein